MLPPFDHSKQLRLLQLSRSAGVNPRTKTRAMRTIRMRTLFILSMRTIRMWTLIMPNARIIRQTTKCQQRGGVLRRETHRAKTQTRKGTGQGWDRQVIRKIDIPTLCVWDLKILLLNRVWNVHSNFRLCVCIRFGSKSSCVQYLT